MIVCTSKDGKRSVRRIDGKQQRQVTGHEGVVALTTSLPVHLTRVTCPWPRALLLRHRCEKKVTRLHQQKLSMVTNGHTSHKWRATSPNEALKSPTMVP